MGLRAPLATTPPAPAWRPLLAGASARRALDTARAIGDELRAVELASPALYDGHAGLVVLFDYLDRIDGGAWDRAIAHHLARALELAPAGPPLSLYFGRLGVAWLLERMRGWLGGAGDPCAAADRAVLAQLADDAAPLSHELAAGLAGIAVYALERGLAAALAPIARRLAAGAEHTPAGARWLTGPDHLRPDARRDYPAGYYNLGVMHGAPGVIAVLAALARAGHAPGAQPLARAGLGWLFAQGAGDRPLPRLAGEPAPAGFRASWCSGELAIAGCFHAARCSELAAAARVIGEPALTHCLDDDQGGDAGFCHGAAGLAHVLNRIAQRTGSLRCRAAALAAIERALTRVDGRRRALAVTRPGGPCAESWRARPYLVDGAAGVALALAAAASALEPSWDRLFLLSFAG